MRMPNVAAPVCCAVVEGEDIVRKLESTGTASGATRGMSFIADCGELER